MIPATGILFLLMSFGLGSSRASEPISAIWVSDEFSASREKVLDRVFNLYCEQKSIKFDEFDVIHYANRIWNKGDDDLCNSKKKTVQYSSRKAECNYQACTELGSIIKKNESMDITLLWCSTRKECSSEFNDINLIQVANNDDAIKEELEKIMDKKRRRETLVIIYVAGNKESPKPTVSMTTESHSIEVGESVELRPAYKGSFSTIAWSPAQGLSCTNCQFPTASPASSTTYTVQVTEENGCKSDEVKVIVNVKNNCVTGNTPPDLFLQERINFFNESTKEHDDIPTKFRRIRAQGGATWRILSNQSGGDIYDLIVNASCGQCFKLSVFDDLGENVKNFFYKLEEVDNRASNRYHEYMPDKFVFRMDLTNMQGIKDARRTFLIRIYAYEKCGDRDPLLQSKSNITVRFDHCEIFETDDESE
jgi:hypothetical protein